MPRRTVNDVQLAKVYFSILIERAKRHLPPMTYGELVDEAKRRNPDNSVVQNAIATSAGRKLYVVHAFCVENNYPALPSLVVSKGTREVGDGFHGLEDVNAPELEREKVYAYDWANVVSGISDFFAEEIVKATPKKIIKEKEAVDIMVRHYQSNQDKYKANVPYLRSNPVRNSLIALIMEDVPVEDAYDEVING